MDERYEVIEEYLQECVNEDIYTEEFANEVLELAYDKYVMENGNKSKKENKGLSPNEIAIDASGAIIAGTALGAFIVKKLKTNKGYENNPELKKVKDKIDKIVKGLKDIKSDLSSDYWKDWNAYITLSIASSDHQNYYNSSYSNLSVGGTSVYSSYNIHKNREFDWERGKKEKELAKKYKNSALKLNASKNKVKEYIKELKVIAKECDSLAKKGESSSENIKAIQTKLNKLETKIFFNGYK